MKKYKIMTAALLIGAGATAFNVADDILAKLNLHQQDAQQAVLKNLVGQLYLEPINERTVYGHTDDVEAQMRAFRTPRIAKANIAAMMNGNKAEAARELCNYVKNYLHSKTFIAQYNKAREAAKPTSEPVRMDAAAVASMQKNVKDQEKNLANLKKNKMVPAAMTEKMEQSIANQKRTLANNEDPAPNKTKWMKMYPEDPSVIIKTRLQEYLSLAATVDFNAKLHGPNKSGKMEFVNPAYENQSLKWKAIFRAGKEVNDATMAFVSQWLKEGIKLNSIAMATPSASKSEGSSNSSTSPNDEKPQKGLFNKIKSVIKQGQE